MKPPIVREPDSGYLRLEQQIAWYDEKSKQCQRYYKSTKVAELLCAALVPFLANLNGGVTAAMGIGIVMFECLQQMNQWSQNWITYRSTCEALRHEKYLYLGRSAVYSDLGDDEARKALVERVESLISTEHAKWISRQEYAKKHLDDKGADAK